MDKEEFRIKLEEINKLVQKKDYKGAMGIVDSIDWRRVKNVRTLCVVGEIYAANGRYEDSKEIFLLAYHKASIGKNILYRLIEISLRMKDVDEAMEFFEEYKQVASNDNTQYILQYKIARGKNASLNEQIRILEEYKEHEFTEKWSYELAALYYKAGEKQKALDLCNEIILWFSEGKYVMKAYDLKMRMGELTGSEKTKFEQQFVPKLLTPEEAKEMELKKAEDTEEAEKTVETSEVEETSQEVQQEKLQETEEVTPISARDLNNMESIQEKISQGIRDIFGTNRKREEELGLQEETSELINETPSVEQPQEVLKEVEEAEQPAEPKAEPEVDFSKTMRMPELKIPASMRNMEPSTAPKVEELSNTLFKENGAGSDFEFNLEDTILAAASAQGIEIPKEAPEKIEEIPAIDKTEESHKVNELEEPDFLSAISFEIEDPAIKELEDDIEKKISELESVEVPDVPMIEEEEDLTEEDLRSAEEEFLRGPISKSETDAELEIESDQELNSDQDLDESVGLELEEPQNFVQDEEEFIEEQQPLTQEEELERFIESIRPEEEKDPQNIIPREKELTEEENQLFTYFTKVPGMKEQLVEALCDAQLAAADKTSKTGNIIVMGGKECGKTRLISSLIPAICKELNLEASKVAYVFADQINGKNIYKIFSKLAGGFLVIENANQLTAETAEMLDKAMEANTDGLTVIIEDEKIGMRKLIARFPKFAKKFTSMINIPVFTNDELVNFARVYTKENGYAIDQMGMLALYNLIGINQKEDEPMNVGAVKELIDTAIAKSQGGIRKFKRNISKKRTDRDGYIVLYEKDFSK